MVSFLDITKYPIYPPVVQLPPKKWLVYQVAMGASSYHIQRAISYATLRHAGYTGDVALLTTDDLPPISGVNIVKLKNGIDPCIARACIDEVMDISKYDALLYVDTDVVFLPNYSALLDLRSPMMVTLDYITIEESKTIFPVNTIFMSPEEIIRNADKKAIAAGTFAIDSKYAPGVFDRWREICSTKEPKFGHDQAALNAMVHCGEVEAGFYPFGTARFSLFEDPAPDQTTSLLHFNKGPQTTRTGQALDIAIQLGAVRSAAFNI